MFPTSKQFYLSKDLPFTPCSYRGCDHCRTRQGKLRFPWWVVLQHVSFRWWLVGCVCLVVGFFSFLFGKAWTFTQTPMPKWNFTTTEARKYFFLFSKKKKVLKKLKIMIFLPLSLQNRQECRLTTLSIFYIKHQHLLKEPISTQFPHTSLQRT